MKQVFFNRFMHFSVLILKFINFIVRVCNMCPAEGVWFGGMSWSKYVSLFIAKAMGIVVWALVCAGFFRNQSNRKK